MRAKRCTHVSTGLLGRRESTCDTIARVRPCRIPVLTESAPGDCAAARATHTRHGHGVVAVTSKKGRRVAVCGGAWRPRVCVCVCVCGHCYARTPREAHNTHSHEHEKQQNTPTGLEASVSPARNYRRGCRVKMASSLRAAARCRQAPLRTSARVPLPLRGGDNDDWLRPDVGDASESVCQHNDMTVPVVTARTHNNYTRARHHRGPSARDRAVAASAQRPCASAWERGKNKSPVRRLARGQPVSLCQEPLERALLRLLVTGEVCTQGSSRSVDLLRLCQPCPGDNIDYAPSVRNCSVLQ